MDTRNSLDKIFRKLDGYLPDDIPEGLSWNDQRQGILDKVAKRRRRRIGVFYWVGALAALLFLFATWTWHTDATEGLGSPRTIETTQNGEVKNKVESAGAQDLPAQRFEVVGEIENEDDKTSIIPTHPQLFQHVYDPMISIEPKQLDSLRASGIEKTDKRTDSKIGFIGERDYSRGVDSLATISNLPVGYLTLEMNQHEIRPLNLSIENSISKITNWNLDILGGVNYFNFGYTNASEGLTPSLEKPQVGWNVGLQLSKNRKGPWFYGVGIRYNQLRYLFTNELAEQTQLFRLNTIDTLFVNTVRQDTNIVYRDSLPGIRTLRVQNQNTHHLLQIPVFLGLHKRVRRFGFGVKAGLNFQVFKRTVGKTAVNFPEIIILELDDFYKNDFGLGLFLGAELNYQITRNISITGQLYLERSLSNWLNDTAGFSSETWSLLFSNWDEATFC